MTISESDAQDRFGRLWAINPSEEVLVATYTSGGQPVIHSAKTIDGNRIHRLQQPNPRWKETHDAISKFHCSKCPYGTDELSVLAFNPFDEQHNTQNDQAMDCDDPSPVPYMAPPPHCLLGCLNDDTILYLAEHLLAESFTAFSVAYPRFHYLITNHHVVLQRELRCFFLRTSLKDTIMGVGVSLEPRSRTLSSDFDWLSGDAFTTHGVRTSIQKHSFEFFLPLAFNRSHFDRANPEIWRRLDELDKAVRRADAAMSRRIPTNRNAPSPPKPHDTVRVIYKMMNNIVVALMKSCDDVLGRQSNGGSYRRPQQTMR